jgi:hypothetical protein
VLHGAYHAYEALKVVRASLKSGDKAFRVQGCEFLCLASTRLRLDVMSRLYYGWHWKHMSESEHQIWQSMLIDNEVLYRRRHVCNTDMQIFQI